MQWGHQRESIELHLRNQRTRDIIRKGHERCEGKRCEFCAPRGISEYVVEIQDAGFDLEREVLQLWSKEEIQVVESVGGLDAPDERGEVGKDISTRTVILNDQEDRGRCALGAFVIVQAPPMLTILKDLLPVFRGQRFSRCLWCEDWLEKVRMLFNSLGLAQGACPS